MKKSIFLEKMEVAGDAVVMYRSINSKKLKYNVCTMEFDTPYIKSKRNNVKLKERHLLLFCWDTNSFRQLDPKIITNIQPLASILKNRKKYD